MAVTTSNLPSPVAVLRACGFLAAGTGLAGEEDLSSSHSVLRATREDGAQAIVKHRRPDGRRGLAPELFVYRLAGWAAGLGAVLARPLLIDERAQILVLEALPWAGDAHRRVAEPDFMRRIGATLAQVHAATLGQPMPQSPAAGILQVADHPQECGLDRPPQTRALMHRIAADAPLADALRQAKADYRPRCLIHGDLRPEHWVEMRDGSLRLLDWEMGGGGDPMLDLASALVEPALAEVRAGRSAEGWLALGGEATAALVAGYRDGGGAALLYRPCGHLQRLGAARLLHIACEWADAGGLAGAVDALVAAARSLTLSHAAATERLAA